MRCYRSSFRRNGKLAVNILDVVVGSNINLAMLYHSVAGLIGAGTYIGLRACYRYALKRLTVRQVSHVVSVAVFGERSAVIWPGNVVGCDGKAPGVNDYVASALTGIVIRVCYLNPYFIPADVYEARTTFIPALAAIGAVLDQVIFQEAANSYAVGNPVVDAFIAGDGKVFGGGFRNLEISCLVSDIVIIQFAYRIQCGAYGIIARIFPCRSGVRSGYPVAWQESQKLPCQSRVSVSEHLGLIIRCYRSSLFGDLYNPNTRAHFVVGIHGFYFYCVLSRVNETGISALPCRPSGPAVCAVPIG